MKLKKLINIILLTSFVILASCSQKKEDNTKTTNETTTPTTNTPVASIGGASYAKEASLDPFYAESQVILDELDRPVVDGYVFVVKGEPTGVANFPIQLSVDGINFSETIEVSSVAGKINFYSNVPTKKGLYRVLVKPKNGGTVQGRFFFSVESSEPAVLGVIKGTTYEDEYPYNNKKDSNEKYTLLGDGQSSSYVYIGPILDAFGNPVNQALIRLSTDKGTIISQNPVGITDGVGIFRIESIPSTGPISLVAEALNETNTVIASTFGEIHLVRPHLVIEENGDYGQIFVNETRQKTFILKNIGSTTARDIIKSVTIPYVLENTSTCLSVATLKPGEQCTLDVSFTGGIRNTFPGEINISAIPNTINENRIVHPLRITVVAPAIVGVNDIAMTIEDQACGTTQDYQTFVYNTGDLPGTNFTAVQPVRTNGQPRDVQIILPPADVNPSQDPEDIINCGNTIPAGRKCRVIVRFTPNALRTSESLTGELRVDGKDPILMTIRASSIVGPPAGSIPITLVNANNQVVTGLDIGDTNVVTALVGPITDACSNPIHNYPVSAVSSAGNISVSPINTNNGYVQFAWYGTNNVASIGNQQITVSAGSAVGQKPLVFKGIKLVTTEITGEIGQILTVNYNPAKYFYYTVRNEGTVPALNVTRSVEPSNAGNWFILDQMYQGGCEDNTLNPGEECTIRAKVDTQTFGAGALIGQLIVRATGNGLVENLINLTGVSVNPPTLSFNGAPVINMNTAIAGARPTQVLTLNNLSGNAKVNNLEVNVAPPFEKIATTCTSTLNTNSNCTITVQLPVDTKGTYNTFVQAISEHSSTNITVTSNIVANKATGSIPMSFDKSSVAAAPSNPAAFITVTVGPIKDAYGNNVVAGTVVNLETDKGLMSIDTDSDGLATATTGSGINEGKLSFTIRAKSVSEITNFNIVAKVMDGSTVLATGNKIGSFTGANIAFTQESVDFGQVAVGALDFKVIRLVNNGNENITGLNWNTTSSDFYLSGQGACTSLAPGASCDVTVLVNPIQSGVLTGSVIVNGTGNGIISDTILLEATSVNAAKIVAGNTYNSGNTDYEIKNLTINYIPGSTASTTFKIRNVGQEALQSLISSINTRSTEFNISLPSQCQSLAYDQECTATIVFNPTASVGSEINGEITLTGESPSRITIAKINVKVTSPQLNFITKQSQMQLGTCGAYQVQLQDATEAPVNAAGNISYNLSRNGGTGSFYSNGSCSAGISSISILNGQSSSAIFYYKGTSDGDHTLTVSNNIKSIQTLTKIFTSPQITPATITVSPNDTVNFSTNSGVSPFTYQVVTAGGGTINPSSGNYTAPVIAGTYTIKVTDNIGNTSEATVIVEDIKLAAGKNNWCSLAVGNLKCLGENAFGQYGNNSVRKGHYNEPIPVGKFVAYTPSLGSNVKNIYMGSYHSCATRMDNRLYCQGTNHVGMLGDSTYVDKNTLTAVSGSFTALDAQRAVTTGWGLHTCAIRNDNKLYCWGSNNRGQVGFNNSVIAYNSPQQVTIAGAADFTKVVAGIAHTCALHSSGTINCFGDNTYGQLGNNTNTSQMGSSTVVVETSGIGTLSNIRDIVAGKYHTCAINNSNQMYCWGRNDQGQLGNNTTVDSNKPILITTDVKNVFAGGKHNCLIKQSTNQLQCWGNNTQGQIGQGNTNTFRVPTNISGINSSIGDVALGDNFTCFMHQGINVKCMGENAYGIMGTNDLNNSLSVATVNPSNGNISCMSGGNYDSATGSCRCSSSANVYAYENKNCSAATITNLNTNTLEYGLNNQTFTVGYALKQASVVFSNIPITYSRSGNGSISYSKVITSADDNVLNNTYFRGNQNFESVTATIGSLVATVNYRLFKTTCDQYYTTYGDLSNGIQTLLNASNSPYTAYCRFIGGSGYSYPTLTDYNRTYLESNAAENAVISVPCVYGSNVTSLSGSYYVTAPNTLPYVLFGYDDLVRTGFVINDDLAGDPNPVAAKQGYVTYQCK